MRQINPLLFLVWLLILTGCVSGPNIVPGKGAIYGLVTASSHKAIIKKAARGIDTDYSNEKGEIVYTQDMVNYSALTELYVCLIDSHYVAGTEHLLVAKDGRMSLRSLALAKDDRLRIQNATSRTQTFYLSNINDTEEGFQAFPPLAAGTEGVFPIRLEGHLVLGSDEDERLITSIFSRVGLKGLRISSGSPYAFERLTPGSYDVVFWFWRLGSIQHHVHVQANANFRLDETLSVDRIIR